MFIDETGEASVHSEDPRFNMFSLCAIIFRADCYELFDERMKELKIKHFGTEEIVFHSFHMRRQEGVFKLFKDPMQSARFYTDFEELINCTDYKILSAIVRKDLYRQRYPNKNFAYEESLEFLVERSFHIKRAKQDFTKLFICLEKRSKGKDRMVKKHYARLKASGNVYYPGAKFNFCDPVLKFKEKHHNINGLQFADLCAYPIVRAITFPEIHHPTFEVIKHKIYCDGWGNLNGWGIKVFPA